MQQGNLQDQQISSERRIIRHTNQSHKSCRRRRITWFLFCLPGTTLVDISRIVNIRHIPTDWLSHSNRLAYRMVENRFWLLLQDRLRSLGVMNNRHVLPINICGATQGHTHHYQLVAEATTGLNPILRRNKLSSKDTSLHSWLTPGEPHNWRHV
jgi:hypothetical protein